MKGTFNIFMAGVGGQGIGLLAELMARAADYAGWKVRACDTHGLAQRGGMVTSHLRLGDSNSPLVPDGRADLVLALERTEALRAAALMLRDGGTLAWYDATWQALDVRTGSTPAVTAADVEAAVAARGGTAIRVHRDDLADPRMQNTALVAVVLARAAVPGLDASHVKKAMADLLPEAALKANLSLL